MHVNLDKLGDVLTPRECQAIMRLSKNALYQALARGDVPSVRIGRKLLIPKAALQRMLERCVGQDRNN